MSAILGAEAFTCGEECSILEIKFRGTMNMLAYLARFAAGLLVLSALVLSACASAKEPAAPPARIIAIGDLHGDYDAYENLLEQAGLINKRKRWAGGDAILVQTGDVPDRGPDSLKIIKHLRKIQKQARRKGGRVITLAGNHEAMNLGGDLRYVHPGEYEAFVNRNSVELRNRVYEANRESIESFYLEQDETLSRDAIKEKWFEDTPLGMIEHQRAWRPEGEIGEWVVGNPAVAVIADSLFVHGGISEKYAGFTVAEINRMTAEALKARNLEPDSILNDPMGPLWYRGLVRRGAPEEKEFGEETPMQDASASPSAQSRLSIEEEINLVLDRYGVERIIVAHTPNLDGIKPSHGGKLIQIDTGISEFYGGTHSFLEITVDGVFAHDDGGTSKLETSANAGK